MKYLSVLMFLFFIVSCGQVADPQVETEQAQMPKKEKRSLPLNIVHTIERNDEGQFEVELNISCNVDLSDVSADLSEIKAIHCTKGSGDFTFDKLKAGTDQKITYTVEITRHQYLRYDLSMSINEQRRHGVYLIKVPHLEAEKNEGEAPEDKNDSGEKRKLKLAPATPK